VGLRRPGSRGPGGDLPQQPGLADARLPDDEGGGRCARRRGVEHGVQRGDLHGAPDERPVAGPRGGRRRTSRPSRPGRPGGGRRSQHLRLDGAQAGAGVDAQFPGQLAAHGAQLRERLALAARARQRQRVQRAQALAQRLFAHERLQLPGHRGVLAERQPQEGAVLDRHQPQGFEPGTLGAHGVRLPQVRVRRAAPRGEGLVEVAAQGCGVHAGGGFRQGAGRACEPAVHGLHGRGEAGCVECLRRQGEGVAERGGRDDG
jgi:hypothetical protein